jgi:hypothetical protein
LERMRQDGDLGVMRKEEDEEIGLEKWGIVVN